MEDSVVTRWYSASADTWRPDTVAVVSCIRTSERRPDRAGKGARVRRRGCVTLWSIRISLESYAMVGWMCLHFRLTQFFTHHFFLFWFTTLIIHKPISFTPGLKPTCFTNPTPVVSLLPPGLLSRTIARTVSSEVLGFCLLNYFSFLCCALD